MQTERQMKINTSSKISECMKLTCCPRQMRGPALNGKNMNALGTRYFLSLSSRKRSGSNSLAVVFWAVRSSDDAYTTCMGYKLTVWTPKIFTAVHHEHRV